MSPLLHGIIRCLMSAAVLGALSVVSSAAVAMGLQVSPISIDVPDTKQATELWLINSSATPLQAQVRVYQWAQRDNHDTLTPTTALIVSPPVAKIAANSRQLVRVMCPKGERRTGPLSTFRIVVNELPSSDAKNTGVDFVMAYSIPVFVYGTVSPDTLAPALTLGLVAQGNTVALRANNQGSLYAKLSALTFIDRKGKRTVLNSGLVGYVLPHREMTWNTGKPAVFFAQGGTLELFVNGKIQTETRVSLNQ